MRPSSSISRRLRALAQPLVLCASLAACGGGDSGPAITVTVAADPMTIQPGAIAQVTATVLNDPANGGVSWAVSCSAADCGTVSPVATATGVATTYTAPSARPPADLTITITATSASDSRAKGTLNVTVAGGIGVSVQVLGNSSVPAGTTTQLSASVVNDPAARGVTWSVSCATAPCGMVSPAATASDVPTTYTASLPQPANDVSVTLTATTVTDKGVSASVTIIVPGITVAVDPSSVKDVTAGASVNFTATVGYDNQGVNWSLQCSASDCGKIAPLASASGAPVTYTAPAAPPPTDLQVTVVARSVGAPSVQGTALVVVRAVAVSIKPMSALVPLNTTQSFTGSVGFDPTASNVAWELMQGGTSCPSACGSIAPTMTANLGATTYSAPGSLPANATVTLTATSVPDKLSSTTATIVITTGSVQLAPLDMTFVKTASNHPPPPQIATLTNTGKGTLAIQNISIGGTGFRQTNTCGTSVAAGASCDISVSFRPSSGHNGATFTGTLTIDDASTDSPQQIHLTASIHYGASAAMLDALARKSSVRTPLPGGSNEVGTRAVYLLDTRRADPYVANSATRDLRVQFWYPAAEGTSCVRAAYISPQVRSYISTLLGVSFPEVSTHSCRDAPMSSGPHPVVVLTHGFTGTSTDYTFIAEDLASRGYVVASVDHTHEATAVEFPDGRVEKSVLGSHFTNDWHSDAGTLGFAVAVRLADLRFVLDELQRLNAGRDSHFAGRLDLSRIAIAGHSLGGLTTLRALESEPRFKAGIVLDGVMPPHFAKPIEQPVLSVAAGRERWNEDDCRLWDALHGPRVAVNLPGAEHIALSDAVWLLDGSIQTGEATASQVVTAIREYVAGFLDANLRGKGSGSSSISSAHYPGAIAATTAQSLCRAP